MRDTSLRVMKSCFLLFRYTFLQFNSFSFLVRRFNFIIFWVFFFFFFPFNKKQLFIITRANERVPSSRHPSISFNFSRSIDIRLSKIGNTRTLSLLFIYLSFVLTITDLAKHVFIKIHNKSLRVITYFFILPLLSRFSFSLSLLNVCCYLSIFHLVPRKACSSL